MGYIVMERLSYFKQLIQSCKNMEAESPLEVDDSMISDYLKQMNNAKPGEINYFSGSFLTVFNHFFI